MKKLVFWSILIISLFSLVQNTGAVSYGGSSQYVIPQVLSLSGVPLYSSSAPTSGEYSYSFPVVDTEGQPTRLLAFAYGIRFKSGAIGSYSGKLSTIYFGACTNGQGSYCYGTASTEIFLMMESPTATENSSRVYIRIRYPDGGTDDITQFYLSSRASCPGTSPDCILIVQPRFYSRPTTGYSAGVYLAYSDYTFYNQPDGRSSYVRSYFGDLSATGPQPTLYQSTLEFLGLGVTGYGMSLNFPYDLPTRNDYWGKYFFGQSRIMMYTEPFPGNDVSGIGFDIVSANPFDDTILRDYFVGNTGSVLTTFTNWIGSTGLNVTTISQVGNVTVSSGLTLTGSSTFFSECGSLSVGCYIEGAFNATSSALNTITAPIWAVVDGVGYVWTLLKDWSNGNFHIFPVGYQTCTTISTMSNSGSTLSGSTLSGTLANLGGRIKNLISLVNPSAPKEGDLVCHLNGTTSVVHYGHQNAMIVDYLIILVCIFPFLFGASAAQGVSNNSISVADVHEGHKMITRHLDRRTIRPEILSPPRNTSTIEYKQIPRYVPVGPLISNAQRRRLITARLDSNK